jgi:ribose-phosphate pyrophosphokinase
MANYSHVYAVDMCGETFHLDCSVYPDNVPILKMDVDLTKKAIKTIVVRPFHMTDFMAAMFFVDAWKWRFGYAPNLILPFVPGARQDRLNDSGDFLFTAKSIANMINERQFPKVTILDPHSEVISGLINNCEVVHSDVVCNIIPYFPRNEYSAVISPDAGAEKRAARFAKALKLPLVHAWKTRSVTDGSISGFGFEPFTATGKVLVVDDICDGGGTFLGLGAKLAESGIKADLFVTHGIFSKGTKALTKMFENVYTTDSIVNSPDQIPGVKIIEICDRLTKGNY